MGIPAEQLLVQAIEAATAPHGFQRIDIESADVTLHLLAAWKRKTWNMNRGIALVSLSGDSHPGELARSVKSPIGKFIGYFPFLYELGLQLVLVGRSVLHRSTGLEQFLDTVSQSVTLQSIHLVDVDTGNLLDDLPVHTDLKSEIPLPGWAKALEWVGRIKNPLAGEYLRGSARLRYSVEARRAAVSVRTWGQTQTGRYIDAIEDGIDQYVHSDS